MATMDDMKREIDRLVLERDAAQGNADYNYRLLMAERERCAEVVENMGRSNGRVRKPYKLAAAEIRSGNSRIGNL